MTDLKNEIHDYWTNRARGYSEYNQQEMADARRTMWRDKLLVLLGNQFPEREPREIKILDVGTGPGFFAILLAEAGYQVTAIDYTEEMLKEAQQNAGGLAKCIVWKTGDAQALDVESNSFDVIVTRNVTWNLPRPDLAYKEWLRVLKPGGVLYNFDADWYGHLYNEEKRSGYEKDRQQTEEQNVEDYYSGTDIEKMEEIARQVPLSRLERPKWDLETMRKTGFLDVSCDENVWKEVWTEEEIINNSSSPIWRCSCSICSRRSRRCALTSRPEHGPKTRAPSTPCAFCHRARRRATTAACSTRAWWRARPGRSGRRSCRTWTACGERTARCAGSCAARCSAGTLRSCAACWPRRAACAARAWARRCGRLRTCA